jgi:hypothetical protein
MEREIIGTVVGVEAKDANACFVEEVVCSGQ